ncbi:MAG: hypothetical protein WB698_15755 [Solirubrobacteraceae bacterium]
MKVVCAIPLQIPVHRIRVTVHCRELGTALHHTVERLAAQTEDPELIAAVTGLTLTQIARVQGELARELAPIEREYVLWVDNARERALPYSALDGVVTVRRRDGGITLPLEPPTKTDLERIGLDAAASWEAGVDGHVEIEEILDVAADTRGAGGGPASHVLRLPDTQLLIHFDPQNRDQPRVAVAQHAQEDPELTDWLHAHYGNPPQPDTLDLRHITEARPLPPSWLATLATRTKTERKRPWTFTGPHPQHVRDAIAEVAETASDRLDVCAPDLTRLPEWLQSTLVEAAARGVTVVLRPTTPHPPPRRLEATVTPLPTQPDALCVIADMNAAAIHTDPNACLDRGTDRAPQPQHLVITHAEPAVSALLDLLTLKPPRRRAPSEKLAPNTIRTLLDKALATLQDELPEGVTATIEPEDERFAATTLDRYHLPGAHPTDSIHAAAAGTAWERATIATAISLCAANSDRLALLATRWSPPEGGIDLDLILADNTTQTVWVIDAKHRPPAAEQEGKMIHQLRILATSSQLLPPDWHTTGVIVHPAKHLRTSPHQTEHRNILRSTLRDLPALLLADTLPDRRVG